MSGFHLRKPAPADFAQNAMKESMTELRKRYRQGTKTLQRWIAEEGITRPVMMGGRAKRPMPDDFATIAPTMTNVCLMAHYGCGANLLDRWLKEAGVVRFKAEHIPDDFAERWKTSSQIQLARHYVRSTSTISAWVERLGLHRPRGPHIVPKAPAPRPSRKRTSSVAVKSDPARLIKPDAFRTAPLDRVQRDMSDAGQAADFLRRFGPVYRCDVRGRPLSDGFFWRRGNAVMTDAELIERADWMRERKAA